jgi:hypothetical protein
MRRTTATAPLMRSETVIFVYPPLEPYPAQLVMRETAAGIPLRTTPPAAAVNSIPSALPWGRSSLGRAPQTCLLVLETS